MRERIQITMNSKYYPIIKLSRQAALMKRRLTLPFRLLKSGFWKSASYYPEMPQKSRSRILFELMGHIMKYGSIEWYYFAYGFDIKGFRNKRDYLDDNDFLWKCSMLNTILPAHDYTCILRDKALFSELLTLWGFKTPQTIACVKSKGDADEAIKTVFGSRGQYFCKPLDGECGDGIFRLIVHEDGAEIDGKCFLWAEAESIIRGRFTSRAYLVQKFLIQHSEVSKIYEKSVNTLRILTIFDKTTKNVVPVAGELRLGANGNVMDNLAAGGVAVGVDLQTGQLSEYGVCKKGGAKRTRNHPDTHAEFSQVCLPFVEEAVKQARELHFKLSSIRIIGWDIAITSDGPAFIEGNDNPEISGLQTVNGGLKKKVQEILRSDLN